VRQVGVVNSSAGKDVRASHERHRVVAANHQHLEAGTVRRIAQHDDGRGGARCSNGHSLKDIVWL
jgi:hypothetical protein